MPDPGTRRTVFEYYQKDAYVRAAEEHSLRGREKRLGTLRQYLDPGRPAVELGCGTGVFSDVSDRYVGLDISVTALRALRAKGRWAVCCDISYLPLKDGVAGTVFSFDTLEHIHEPQKTLAEVARVLGRGGAAVLKDAWLKTEKHRGILPRPVRKVLGNIASRFRRLGREVAGSCRVASWPITPDYSQIAEDHDAVSRIDAHSVFRFFRARGFDTLNEHRNPVLRILRLWTRHRHWVIARKR